MLVEEEGSTYMADSDSDGDSDEAHVPRPLQAAACTYRIAFGPRAGQKVLTVQGAMPSKSPRARFRAYADTRIRCMTRDSTTRT